MLSLSSGIVVLEETELLRKGTFENTVATAHHKKTHFIGR
jgi:hypothetical protein